MYGRMDYFLMVRLRSEENDSERERCSSASVRNTCDRAPLSAKAINKMAAPFCLHTNVRNKRKIKTGMERREEGEGKGGGREKG